MKLLVISHKLCWHSVNSPSGFATDGGFPIQMQALSELFNSTTVAVPILPKGSSEGEIPITGHELIIAPLTPPKGTKLWRKILLLFWLIRNSVMLATNIYKADIVHVPIPSDIGTIGILIAMAARKRLFVRHCGNWHIQRTLAETVWKIFMEQFASKKNVMLATGGASRQPSRHNQHIRWIFSTTLTRKELEHCSINNNRNIKTGARLIIVCRQTRNKGTGHLIDSLPLILKTIPDVALDVVGDGEALQEFKLHAIHLGIEDKIKFHGKVNHEEVIKLLKQAHVFCYPTSASEGFPKVVLEALACGLPVITTRVSVLPELIMNGCGVLIYDKTPLQIARAVQFCLSDPHIYHYMSTRACITAERFSLECWQDTVGDYLQAAFGELKVQ